MANSLWVGPDQAFHTISSAVSASQSGDTIYVEAGTYVNDWASINHDVNIIGVGGYAHLVSTEPIDNGKAELVVNGNVTVQNLEFSGATVGDNNGAGIRDESGNLTVLNSSFHDNQEGILAGDNPNGNIVIQNSSFVHNGAGDGQTHGVYVGQIASLTVDGSSFSDQVDGNQLKSRAAETTVTNSHFVTGADGANYDIDLPNGGVASVHDNTFDKGVGTNNPAIIHYGGEIADPVGSLSVAHNSFTSEIPNATAVLDQTNLPVSVTDNTLSNIAHTELGGVATLVDNVDGAATTAASDPSLGAAPVDVTPPTADTTTAATDPTTAVTDPTTSATVPTTPVADPTTAVSDPTTAVSDPATVATTADPSAADPAADSLPTKSADPTATATPAAPPASDGQTAADAGSSGSGAAPAATAPAAPASDPHGFADHQYLAGLKAQGSNDTSHSGWADGWMHHDQPVTLAGATNQHDGGGMHHHA